MIDRRLSPHLDWALLGALIVLSLVGLVMIYSATYDPTTGEVGPQLTRQLGALLIGFVALGVCLIIDYRVLADHALLIYAGLAALLVYTLFFGVEMGGAQRWIGLGPVNLQPSEFARLVLAARAGRVLRQHSHGDPAG